MNKNERQMAVEKLVAEKATAEAAIASGAKGLALRKAETVLAKFEARMADLQIFVSEENKAAFLAAENNVAASLVAKRIQSEDEGFFAGIRLRELLALRPDFAWEEAKVAEELSAGVAPSKWDAFGGTCKPMATTLGGRVR